MAGRQEIDEEKNPVNPVNPVKKLFHFGIRCLFFFSHAVVVHFVEEGLITDFKHLGGLYFIPPGHIKGL